MRPWTLPWGDRVGGGPRPWDIYTHTLEAQAKSLSRELEKKKEALDKAEKDALAATTKALAIQRQYEADPHFRPYA